MGFGPKDTKFQVCRMKKFWKSKAHVLVNYSQYCKGYPKFAKRVELKWSHHTRTVWGDGSINDLDCGDHFTIYGPVLNPGLSPTLCDPMDYSRLVPLSVGILHTRIWSGLPCPPPGHLPNPDLLHCGQIPYRLSLQGSPGGSQYIMYIKMPCAHLKRV